jgi:hypothetical protein
MGSDFTGTIAHFVKDRLDFFFGNAMLGTNVDQDPFQVVGDNAL